MAVCSNCGVENPAGSRFCGGCGGRLSRVCVACGTVNAPAMRFCNHCGARLGTPHPRAATGNPMA
ncbi:MAG: zinc-ribbon domain-containing protein [Gaiellaceae bacterium]